MISLEIKEMSCKEKAELTYAALKKRKIYRERRNENMATEVHISLIERCKRRKRDRKPY